MTTGAAHRHRDPGGFCYFVRLEIDNLMTIKADGTAG
jgi:hypothetical protein